MSAEAENDKRVVIRNYNYYAGLVYVKNVPSHDFDPSEVTIVWEAYQGGGAQIIIQGAKELEALGRLLLEAAETIDPDRMERG